MYDDGGGGTFKTSYKQNGKPNILGCGTTSYVRASIAIEFARYNSQTQVHVFVSW